jgi:two-component sensor histidine kinase
LQHRVRNNLQTVSAMLSSYAKTGLDETARHQVDSISSLVMTLAQIYDSLLGVGLSDTIDLNNYLRELCNSLPELQNDRKWKVDLNYQAESVMLPLNSVTTLGMVVAELVTNSYRHAFPNQNGTIDVTLTRSPDDVRAILTIQDDGIGFHAKTATSRRGLRLAEKLIEQMGGTLDVRQTTGTLWTLAFPVTIADA